MVGWSRQRFPASWLALAMAVSLAFGASCQPSPQADGRTAHHGTVRHDFFPLTAGHAGLDCVRCHTSGTEGPIPSQCLSCHQADRERAPSHVALHLPEDCTRCHTIEAWKPSSLHHPFPLEGSHQTACTSCHRGQDTRTFSCVECHSHAKAEMDASHSGIPGYGYDSNACYRCHAD